MKMILRVGTQCRSRCFLLLWPCSRVIQHRSLDPRRHSGAGMTRILRYTRFFSTDEQTTKGKHLAQAENETVVASSGSTYSALLDSAKTKSQLSNREQFGLVLKEFMAREKYRRGHVTFINIALERMEEFSLEKDLLTYNRLLDVFPKGRYQPKRLLDALWPRPLPQIELALELLTRMEDNGVWPDAATYSLLIEVFGKRSLPVEKCERMFYWYDRYKDADPYWIDGEIPSEEMELAKLALQRIVKNSGSITEHEVMLHGEERSGFILSGHTATQLKAIDQLSSTTPDTCGLVLHVEGPHRIWINKSPVQYFSLRLDAKDSTNDDEGAVLAVCACQPPTQSSLQQWIKEVQLAYPHFTNATVLYNIRTDDSFLDSASTVMIE